MSGDCDEIVHELQIYLDGETDEEFADRVARHLDRCAPCLDRAEFERRLRAIVAAKCGTECAPAELRERIIVRLFSS